MFPSVLSILNYSEKTLLSQILNLYQTLQQVLKSKNTCNSEISYKLLCDVNSYKCPEKNTTYKPKCELTSSFPVLNFLSVPFGGGAPFCASNLVFVCCWADAWRFSADFPCWSTCCADEGNVVVTEECVNRLLPLSSLLVPSVSCLPGSRDALKQEQSKFLFRNNNKSFSCIFKMHMHPYPFFWEGHLCALTAVTINTCLSSS